MADIAHLAAGVLLEAELDDADGTILVGNRPVDADNGGALETGGNGAIEVLLASDVQLVDHDAVVEHGDAEGDVKGLFIELEGRGIVHLISADGLAVDLVDDLFFRLEFHQRGPVVLAQLRKRRPHVAENLRVIIRAIAACGTAAEELLGGQELLMDFETGFEADSGVIVGLHLFKGFEGRHRARLGN